MAKAANERLSLLNLGSYSIKGTVGSFENNLFQLDGVQSIKGETQLTSQSSFEDYLAVLDAALGALKTGVFKASKQIHLVMNPTFLMAKIIGMPEFAKTDLDAVMKDRLERDSAVANKPNGLNDFVTAHILYDKLKEEDKVDEQSDIALLATMCEQAMVEALKQSLAKHDFVLAGLWSEIVALAGLMKRHDPQAFGGSVAVVNVGHNLTTFQIFSEGRCLFFRPIYTAGQQLTKDVLTITNDETIDFKQAEELKHRMTLAPGDIDPGSLSPLEALVQTISESAALKEFSLIRKLDISFEYLNANLKKRISRVYFTGGTANLKGLLHHIKNNTSLPQGELIDISDKIKLATELPGDEGRDVYLNHGCTVGLALAIKDDIFKELNLVHKGGKKLDFKNLSVWLEANKLKVAYSTEAFLAVFLAGGLAFQYSGLAPQLQAAQENYAVKLDARERAEQKQANLFQGDVVGLLRAQGEARAAVSFYRALAERRVDWLKLLLEFSNAITPGEIAFNDLTFDVGLAKGDSPLKASTEFPPIVVHGKAFRAEPVNRLAELLKKGPMFQRVEVTRIGKPGKEDRFEGIIFELSLVPK